jgi:hypothetical protein
MCPVFACALGCVISAGPVWAQSKQSKSPPVISKLIAKYQAATAGLRPVAIWKYRYRGAKVFFVPTLSCCDTMSTLYNVSGQVICHPGGGIAGGGDGACDDFFKKRTDGVELWHRPGAPPSADLSIQSSGQR